MTNQQNEERRIGGQTSVITGNPVKSDSAAVLGSEAFTAELNVGGGAEEGGEDGLYVAVPSKEGERVVGTSQEGESREETVTCASEDFEGGVWDGGGGHGYGGGGDVDGEERGRRRRRQVEGSD